MNYEVLEKKYESLLHEAMETDEHAYNAQKAGKTAQAAQEYAKASALYAQAASALLDLAELYSPQEQADVQKSIDRLIQISRDLRAEAADLASADQDGSAKPSVRADEGESTAGFNVAAQPETTFDDIAGLTDAKQMIMDQIINPLLYERVYKRFQLGHNGGLLLFGPPGGGKTMLARALANKANMAFFSVKCSDIVSKFFGEAEQNIRALFQSAREAKNAVIFFDEAEALACRRGGNSTVMARLVPEFLSQMDGFDRHDGHIIVIFATNRPFDLDPAFLRPGRLATHCYIPLPDEEVRRTLLTKLVQARPTQGEIDIEALVEKTDRFSCADLVNLIRRACQLPVNRIIKRTEQGEPDPEEFLTQPDLDKALSTVHPSVEPEELQRLEKWMDKFGISYPKSNTAA